jgi:hypothetical protein
VLNNKRFDLIERRLAKIECKLEAIDTRLNEMTLHVAKLKWITGNSGGEYE